MNTHHESSEPGYARTLAGALARIALHEWSAVHGHYGELRERWAVARRARGVGELLRDQVDLLPETQARLGQDRQVRRELLRRWRQAVIRA